MTISHMALPFRLAALAVIGAVAIDAHVTSEACKDLTFMRGHEWGFKEDANWMDTSCIMDIGMCTAAGYSHYYGDLQLDGSPHPFGWGNMGDGSMCVEYCGCPEIVAAVEGELECDTVSEYVDCMHDSYVYESVNNGACADNGMEPITSINSCATAAESIGFPDTTPAEVPSHLSRPEGCYTYQDELYFALGNVGNGADEDGREPLCQTTPQPLTCGAGTVESDEGGECVPDPETAPLTCGDGTTEQDGQCFPEAAPLTCGAGTVEQGGECVPDPATPPPCGAGTVVSEGGECVPDPATPPPCGDGTTDQDGQCVSSLVCGDGTTELDGQCFAINEVDCGNDDGFVLAEVGTCPAGTNFVESAEDCEAAATSLALADTTQTTGDSHWTMHPYGCYFKTETDRLYFNPYGGTNDDDPMRLSVCTCATSEITLEFGGSLVNYTGGEVETFGQQFLDALGDGAADVESFTITQDGVEFASFEVGGDGNVVLVWWVGDNRRRAARQSSGGGGGGGGGGGAGGFEVKASLRPSVKSSRAAAISELLNRRIAAGEATFTRPTRLVTPGGSAALAVGRPAWAGRRPPWLLRPESGQELDEDAPVFGFDALANKSKQGLVRVQPMGGCTRCETGRYLLAGICVQAADCTAAGYSPVSGGGQVGPRCVAPAAPAGGAGSCVDKRDDCHKCAADRSACERCYNGKYLVDGSCAADCPAGLTRAGSGDFNRRCVVPACAAKTEDCHKCNGDGSACAQCYNGKYLLDGVCVAACPAGLDAAGLGNFNRRCERPCTRLEADCHSCSADHAVCERCFHQAYLHDGKCTRACPAGTTGKGQGQYGRVCQPQGSACAPKQADCHLCSAAGDACARCYNAKYLHGGVCVEQCPAGTAPHGRGNFNRKCI